MRKPELFGHYQFILFQLLEPIYLLGENNVHFFTFDVSSKL